MSVTAFLATKACFGACVALYNLVEGDAPDAFEGFGITTGSVFAHYWTKRGEAASVEKVSKLLERDLQAHLDTERVEDVPAILADLHEFGPKFIGSAKAVTVAELVQ